VMNVTVPVMVDLDLDELIDSLLMNLCAEHLRDFIIRLDSVVCDWEFTEELYRHFKAEHEVFKAEIEQDFRVGL
jgi:hypothetical protein